MFRHNEVTFGPRDPRSPGTHYTESFALEITNSRVPETAASTGWQPIPRQRSTPYNRSPRKSPRCVLPYGPGHPSGCRSFRADRGGSITQATTPKPTHWVNQNRMLTDKTIPPRCGLIFSVSSKADSSANGLCSSIPTGPVSLSGTATPAASPRKETRNPPESSCPHESVTVRNPPRPVPGSPSHLVVRAGQVQMSLRREFASATP